jgi:hypothetical protein
MEKIKINTIIEIVGMPKEHVVDTMQKVIDLIEKDEEIKLESKDTAEPELIKDLWSTFTEFELEFETFKKLTGFCFDFMPSSVEIILNDVLAKTHQYDMALKRMILEKRAKDRQENSKTA